MATELVALQPELLKAVTVKVNEPAMVGVNTGAAIAGLLNPLEGLHW